MPTSRWLMFFALFAVMNDINAAPPVKHNINASSIGAGVGRALDWNTESSQSPIWCGAACRYLRVSTAKIAPDVGLTYQPIAWPGNSVTTFPNPSPVVRSIPTPQGTADSSGRPILYESATYERGAVDVGRAGQSLTAKVYQSGNQGANQSGTAAAVLAYHVQVQNQSSEGRDFFIRFNAPKSLQGVSAAYNIGGPSGNEPMYVRQEYAKSRSAVDVLVNGLPVWATASNYFFPEDYDGSAYTGLRSDWGYASDNDQYTIFVGRFASGASFNVDFIVRADSIARAPKCGKVTEPATYPNPRVLMHCFLLGEGRNLPAASSKLQRFEIYSKTVSTALLQPLPGVLNSVKDQ